MRPVRFAPVVLTGTSKERFFKGAVDGLRFEGIEFRGKSRQLVNNVYAPFHNVTFKDCLFWPTRHSKNGKTATWTKWPIRVYDAEGIDISHCEFKGREPEHKAYLNLYGNLNVIGNYFHDCYSQALQTTFRATPHHGTLETSDPSRVKGGGRILVASNLIVNCGHVGSHYNRGIARPGFALSQQRCCQQTEVAYHANHLIQRGTGPFKYSGGMARSFGAMNAIGKKYTEGIGNIIEYRQPSDRPVIQLDSNQADYWTGNTLVKGGKVKLLNPKNVVWKGNMDPTGKGVVLHDKKVLGPISGHYEYANGVRTK